MRHVSVAELKANAEELIAAAEAGEEIAIVRNGQDVARITVFAGVGAPVDSRTAEQKERQREAVNAAYELGQRILRESGPTTSAERRAWIKEDRP